MVILVHLAFTARNQKIKPNYIAFKTIIFLRKIHNLARSNSRSEMQSSRSNISNFTLERFIEFHSLYEFLGCT